MPKLLVFAPCEKVIVGQGDNSVSLIGLLENVHVLPGGFPTPPLPPNPTAPGRWFAFCLWEASAEDKGVEYEQRIAVLDPNGKGRVESIVLFSMTKPRHRVVLEAPGFPIIPAGTYNVKLWLRKKGESDWGQELASYPVPQTIAEGSGQTEEKEAETESKSN